jgi:small subunit ribosomal protein S16
MTRMGRKGRACYRLGAYDIRTRRDGSCLEILGSYEPGHPREENRLVIKAERVKHWLSVGATPSDKVATLLRRQGLLRKPARPAGKKKGD